MALTPVIKGNYNLYGSKKSLQSKDTRHVNEPTQRKLLTSSSPAVMTSPPPVQHYRQRSSQSLSQIYITSRRQRLKDDPLRPMNAIVEASEQNLTNQPPTLQQQQRRSAVEVPKLSVARTTNKKRCKSDSLHAASDDDTNNNNSKNRDELVGTDAADQLANCSNVSPTTANKANPFKKLFNKLARSKHGLDPPSDNVKHQVTQKTEVPVDNIQAASHQQQLSATKSLSQVPQEDPNGNG